MAFFAVYAVASSRGGTRTPDRVINSHLLYLAELPGNIDGRRRRLTQPRTAEQEPYSIVITPDRVKRGAPSEATGRCGTR